MTVKDAGLRIRIERGLRDDFLEVCRMQDKPAAQVIREFIHDYIVEHKDSAQGTLFPARPLDRDRRRQMG